MDDLIFYLLTLISWIIIFLTFGYLIVLLRQLRRTRNKPKPEFLSPIEDNQTELLSTLINKQLSEINTKILRLYELVGKTTKAEILTEIEHLKNCIKEFARSIQLIKTQHDEKKQEVKLQIVQFIQFVDQIKNLLELDYENLLAQREQLKRLLKNEELEYQHMLENYTSEIQKLQQLINEIKLRYPQDLIANFSANVAKKVKTLEMLKKQYEVLKNTTEERLRFLDDILDKRSTEIEEFINALKQEKEQELSQLRNEIDRLKHEVVSLDEQIKTIINAIHTEQKTKSELLQRMKKEFENLQAQEYEINNLKLREEYLDKEIARLNTEYEQLQQEYKELSARKSKEIKQLQMYLETAIQKIMSEWENTKNNYLQEIQRLKERISTLSKRKQHLIEIQKKYHAKYQAEHKKLEKELVAKKIELEKISKNMWQEITLRINKLEVVYSQTKRKLEEFKYKLLERIRVYDDKISELKQRSKIREDRIQKNIEKYKQKYLRIIAVLTAEAEQKDMETKSLLQEVVSNEKQIQIQLESKKEQLETYIEQINSTIAKIEFARQETEKFEKELNNKQQQLIAKFDEILQTIDSEKSKLISKLEGLLKLEEEVISIKHTEKSVKK